MADVHPMSWQAMTGSMELRTLLSVTHQWEYSGLGTSTAASRVPSLMVVAGAAAVLSRWPWRPAPKRAGTVRLFHHIKLWASRRTEMVEEVERLTVVEALGTEMIAPDGEASARAKVEDISRWRGGELTVA
jgi:hypothetical protein